MVGEIGDRRHADLAGERRRACSSERLKPATISIASERALARVSTLRPAAEADDADLDATCAHGRSFSLTANALAFSR